MTPVQGESPHNSTEWRNHPHLKGRFHSDYPDDVQVIVHDGGPRLTKAQPEEAWVTVAQVQGGVFRGTILNQLENLVSVKRGDTIKFILPRKFDHLLMVTDKYLTERSAWTIKACTKCGLAELFDAPSDLIRVVFPNLPEGAHMEGFTSFCGACGGVQTVEPSQPTGR